MSFNWPLNTINHSFSDRLKLAWFFLDSRNRWSMGDKVKKFEEDFAKYLGVKYVVATSSGSTANCILSHYWKDKNLTEFNKGKRQVIFNGISWSTNVNPWIRDGFDPVFLDINMQDFSLDCHKLEKYLSKNYKKVSCVFVTGLIGYAPDINSLEDICSQYGVKLMADFCESGLSSYYNFHRGKDTHVGRNLTHTHSFYIGHLLCGLEMGCIGTNDEAEYQEFLLYRNHGMIRSVKNLKNVNFPIYKGLQNKLVDDAFSFARVGSNYRPTEVNAYIASLDLKRVGKYTKCRQDLFDIFFNELDKKKYYLPSINWWGSKNVHFCLPIIVNPAYKESKADLINEVKILLDKNLIERRPIISQTLTRQFIYQQYGDYKDLPNCEFLSKYGCYVGLNVQLEEAQIRSLVSILNRL